MSVEQYPPLQIKKTRLYPNSNNPTLKIGSSTNTQKFIIPGGDVFNPSLLEFSAKWYDNNPLNAVAGVAPANNYYYRYKDACRWIQSIEVKTNEGITLFYCPNVHIYSRSNCLNRNYKKAAHNRGFLTTANRNNTGTFINNQYQRINPSLTYYPDYPPNQIYNNGGFTDLDTIEAPSVVTLARQANGQSFSDQLLATGTPNLQFAYYSFLLSDLFPDSWFNLDDWGYYRTNITITFTFSPANYNFGICGTGLDAGSGQYVLDGFNTGITNQIWLLQNTSLLITTMENKERRDTIIAESMNQREVVFPVIFTTNQSFPAGMPQQNTNFLITVAQKAALLRTYYFIVYDDGDIYIQDTNNDQYGIDDDQYDPDIATGGQKYTSVGYLLNNNLLTSGNIDIDGGEGLEHAKTMFPCDNSLASSFFYNYEGVFPWNHDLTSEDLHNGTGHFSGKRKYGVPFTKDIFIGHNMTINTGIGNFAYTHVIFASCMASFYCENGIWNSQPFHAYPVS